MVVIYFVGLFAFNSITNDSIVNLSKHSLKRLKLLDYVSSKEKIAEFKEKSIIPSDNYIVYAEQPNYKGQSAMARVQLWKLSIHHILSTPNNFIFGSGIGSFEKSNDKYQYPHNIILEIWYELGLIGVLFFSIFLLFCFYPNILSLNKMEYVSFYVLIFSFFITMLSLSLEAMRPFFSIFLLFAMQNKINDTKLLNNNA